jgi:hypothetical protein
MQRLNRGATLLLPAILAILTYSAGPAAAAAAGPEELTIHASVVFAPPDYQPSELTFETAGALNTAGTWDLPEGKGGAVSVADLTFTPAGGNDSFVVRVHSRRTIQVFDEQTCTGYAHEVGHWQLLGGSGAYANLKGHGELSAQATYSGEGDPGQDCEGLVELFTLQLDGSVTR